VKVLFRSFWVAAGLFASINLLASGSPGTVLYGGAGSPGRAVEGPGPLTETLTLSVTSPAALPVGNYTVGFNITLTGQLPSGATAADALSYVSISPVTLNFTGPSQTQTVTEIVSFPASAVAGSYAYLITTNASDWGTVPGYVDGGVYINVTVDPPQATASAPSILINSPLPNSVFNYSAGGPALQIPFSLTATTGSSDPPITSVDADVSGSTVTVSPVGLNTSLVTGSGTIQVAAPGIYTLTTRAYNTAGAGTASVDFTVNILGTAPTVTGLSPANNAVFTYVTGGPALSIPVFCTATSAFGGILTVSATLNGNPIPGFSFTPSGIGSLTGIAGSPIPLQISAGGTYTLVVSVTDILGTTTATSQFTVNQVPPPTVTISAPANGVPVIWPAGTAALNVPVAFAATAGGGNIATVTETLNGVNLGAAVSGVGTPTASFSGTLHITAPGNYTLSVTATDAYATTTTTRQFTVTQVPPPTVTITQPVDGATIQWPAGTTTLNIPVSFSATAGSGNVTAVGVTLNGVTQSAGVSGLGTPTASFSGTLPVSAPGNYTLNVTATDAYGTTTGSAHFAVVQQSPPSVTISAPANGAVYTRPAGSPPTVVPFAFSAKATSGTVSSVNVTLNGSAVAASVSGLNSATATGSGTLQISAGGTYTLAVTAISGGTPGSNSVVFTVNETTAPPPVYSVLWLPPVSLGKPFDGGSTVPIAFSILNSKGKLVRDQSVVIAVSEDGADPELFTYGPKFDHNDDTYMIVLFAYALNYDTDRGVHTYRIDVYNFWPTGSDNVNLLGSKTITTQGRNDGHGNDHGDGRDGKGDDHDGHGDGHDGNGH
jgi:hypothetical protein